MRGKGARNPLWRGIGAACPKKGQKRVNVFFHAGGLDFGARGAPLGRPSGAASGAETRGGAKKTPLCHAAAPALLPPLRCARILDGLLSVTVLLPAHARAQDTLRQAAVACHGPNLTYKLWPNLEWPNLECIWGKKSHVERGGVWGNREKKRPV